MPKVVTGATLNEFVQTGKSEEIKATPRPKPVGVKTEPVPEPKPEPKAEPERKDNPEEPVDFGLEADEHEEVSRSEKIRKIVGKKHWEMKKAQESAAESERFAENQYNRARLAEERAAQLEKENQVLRVKPEAKAEPENKRPDHTDKKYLDDQGQFKAFVYAEDLAKWSADQAIADDRARQKKERDEQTKAEAEALAAERLSKARTQYPDFDAKVNDPALPKVHTAVLDYIAKHERIADLSYYLATHPDYVERINKLDPIVAVGEVGQLVLSFAKPKGKDPDDDGDAKGAPGAPAPIKPLSASTTQGIQTDPAKMSFKELRAFERQRAASRRR